MKKCTLLFLRHGKTAYTGVFPDLTHSGVEQILEAAKEIFGIVSVVKPKSLQIVSSPLPRALGSASIICEELEFDYGSITQEPAIRCMDFLNQERAGELFKSFPNARAVDIAYPKDDRFEAGTVVEKRSAIQARFDEYLKGLLRKFVDGELGDMVIHTSHFEVLWHMASEFGFDEPLIHGELIRFDLYGENEGGGIRIVGTFRGKRLESVCTVDEI